MVLLLSPSARPQHWRLGGGRGLFERSLSMSLSLSLSLSLFGGMGSNPILITFLLLESMEIISKT